MLRLIKLSQKRYFRLGSRISHGFVTLTVFPSCRRSTVNKQALRSVNFGSSKCQQKDFYRREGLTNDLTGGTLMPDTAQYKYSKSNNGRLKWNENY